MALRDALLFVLVFGSLPFILWRPYIGVLVWSVLAYLNPHRLSWGPVFDFRFSLIARCRLDRGGHSLTRTQTNDLDTGHFHLGGVFRLDRRRDAVCAVPRRCGGELEHLVEDQSA